MRERERARTGSRVSYRVLGAACGWPLQRQQGTTGQGVRVRVTSRRRLVHSSRSGAVFEPGPSDWFGLSIGLAPGRRPGIKGSARLPVYGIRVILESGFLRAHSALARQAANLKFRRVTQRARSDGGPPAARRPAAAASARAAITVPASDSTSEVAGCPAGLVQPL